MSLLYPGSIPARKRTVKIFLIAAAMVLIGLAQKVGINPNTQIFGIQILSFNNIIAAGLIIIFIWTLNPSRSGIG
mgnify:FL=1